MAGPGALKIKPEETGDTLRLEVEMLKRRGPIGRVRARALVDGEVAAEGEIVFALVSAP